MNKSRLELQGNKFPPNSKSSSVETVNNLLLVAEGLLKQGQFDQALNNLNQCVSINPEYYEIYRARAVAYRQTGEYQKALADLNRTLELNPDKETAYIQRGEIYRLLKQPREALADLSHAIKLDCYNPLALGQRGILYRNLKEFTKSLADYDGALKLNLNNAWLYGNRAETYHGLKQYRKAVNDYNNVLKLNPSATWVYERRSYPNLWLGDLETARSDFERAWEANPADLMNGWMAEWAAMCQNNFSFSPEVKERLKSMANSNPNHYAAYLCRASLYWWLQIALQESYNQAEMACNLMPDQPEAYFWKGLAAAGLKQNEEAFSLMQKALELGMPRALLGPISWLKKVNPVFYSEYGQGFPAKRVHYRLIQ